MKAIRSTIPFALLGCVWLLAWHLCGSTLVPPPTAVAERLARMSLDAGAYLDVFMTLWRGLVGLALAALAAYAIGIACGLCRPLMEMVSPLVAVLQSCPPIVWISLLMVWVSIGSAIPVAVVCSSSFPVIFINIANGVSGIDARFLEMARIYKVPRMRILRRLVLPAIAGSSKSAFAFAIGITWKVTATAEFFGARNGIGARIQLAFQRLDMPGLFAWTFIIALLGMLLDVLLRGRMPASAGKAG